MPILTRRTFLSGTLSALALPRGVARSWRGDELRVAVVGLRGRGGDHLGGLRKVPGVRVVALCDVDRAVLAAALRAAEAHGDRVAAFTDLRQLLDCRDIDAVSLATPNHWHALQGIWACQAGKDVYVEKPVSHHVWEGAQLVAAAQRHRRIVQAGMQCRSSHGIAAAIAWLREGHLGPIQWVHGLCYKPRPSIGKLQGEAKLPPGLDYDLWCGPSPRQPLRRRNLHYDWHWDFATGNGDLGNQGIHQVDVARWVLGEAGLPRQVLSLGGRLGYDDDGNTPNTQLVWLDYATAPLLFEVRGLPRDRAAQAGDWGKGMDAAHGVRIGVVVHCQGGTLRIPDYTRGIAYDADGKPIREFRGATDHYANWIDAVRRRDPAGLRAPVQEGHVSSALCHLGNVSYRLGQPTDRAAVAAAAAALPFAGPVVEDLLRHLERNGIDLQATPLRLGAPLRPAADGSACLGLPAADPLLRPAYRPGFAVPDLAGSGGGLAANAR